MPLSDLLLPNSDNKHAKVHGPLEAHTLVSQTNQFNFMAAQVQVASQLKPGRWDYQLRSYWDSQLPKLIHYGFPLDFNYSNPLQSSTKNHPSALDFKADVQAYLKEEIKHNAIMRPFNEPPFANFHCSPFMTRPKPAADHRRVIVDLSFPQGASVKACIASNTYLGTDFLLSLPNIDNITNKVKKFGRGSLIFKIDISRAFRHVKVDPPDYPLLGLTLDSHYFDTCVPFRYRHGSAIFQRLTNAIRYIMSTKNYCITN